MKRLNKLLMVSLLFLWTGSLPAFAERLPAVAAFKVIVHPDNPANKIDRKRLEAIFLKKVERWPTDEIILPVDLNPHASVRGLFSQEVLHRTINGVRSYWQQLIFSGRAVPPPELTSEQAVVTYVSQQPSAIGYVSFYTDTTGVKTIRLE